MLRAVTRASYCPPVDPAEFYSTTATLAPVLLLGLALAPPFNGPPKSRPRLLGRLLYMVGPPVVVMFSSLWMLSGIFPESWSGGVKLLVLILLGLHIGGGVVGMTVSDKIELFRPPDRKAEER